jgi:hypothetical protein
VCVHSLCRDRALISIVIQLSGHGHTRQTHASLALRPRTIHVPDGRSLLQQAAAEAEQARLAEAQARSERENRARALAATKSQKLLKRQMEATQAHVRTTVFTFVVRSTMTIAIVTQRYLYVRACPYWHMFCNNDHLMVCKF